MAVIFATNLTDILVPIFAAILAAILEAILNLSVNEDPIMPGWVHIQRRRYV